MIFRTLSDLTTVWHLVSRFRKDGRLGQRTLIFADILQRKCQSGILPLHDPDLSKGTLSYDPQQSKMVEVHCKKEQLLAEAVELHVLTSEGNVGRYHSAGAICW